jgi:hypothetical protein
MKSTILQERQIDACPRKTRGKSAKSVELIDAAARILGEIQPASVRAVCYRLFVAGYIESMAKTNTNKVSRLLVRAREDGLIPWEHVVDETREAERVTTWDSPNQIINAAVRGYRRDYWKDQPAWVEVWSEKGTIRGTLAPILNRYGITFRVMHGYSSATSLRNIAEDTMITEKPLTVLYLGDWDPSGLHMSEVDIPARLARYQGAAFIKRLALDATDVKFDSALPSFDVATKTGDPRHQWFVGRYGQRCWELDALPPPILRSRVEDEILRHLDLDAWNRALQVEAAEKESMRSFLDDWNMSKLRQASNCSGGAA